jgi:hypothetical protein
MTPQELEPRLKPGDCLLYGPKPGSFWGWVIARKTWHGVSHCELFIGKGKSFASRDGIGVGLYPLRSEQIAYVLRPTAWLDWAAFWKWFYTVNGQKYDWFGLLRFVYTKEGSCGNNDKQFCSEAMTRAYRALAAHVFNDKEDADAIAPANFLLSPALTIVETPLSLR